ncbi:MULTISPECIES: UbiA family prenyltransferase [unclassified Undibacterium]|uniref:UbiA family prenyltransferase n=1 Tax=unclassified Undibacterium TaxID=2630295 RepID=UPI002AC8C16A|nr:MULTISPECIES: UbiA family prenyltransferase [unclassified Undibacterium]MEB0138487.1 UbiA family prenyltransferase [Undibacterium sp. CCC2.1]MEB0173910.1 UbiA family prenyltransferase [Undibacterium sp. CCC1.1]MEB0176164.1 UbiA family prenyltransferase [Undibacterium sp. CCC3.4]MEB0215430.1 UbiA family prenyltransferase [Undibacterium sp. 5I2]WPX42770.1 UbiA family prenyltransferase [Undibacterium sp. CCC3.4]
MNSYPLVVDLDGTLIHTDMLQESALAFLREQPCALWRVPLWLMCGKAILKQQLAERTDFDPATLPYHPHFLAELVAQHRNGRSLLLCTASDGKIARRIAAHLGIFDAVIASDGRRNLAGTHKAEALVARFGSGRFDYAGNSSADLAVWSHARAGIAVNADPALLARAQQCCRLEQVFPPEPIGVRGWCQALRVHQWLKNLLIFIPLFGAHQLGALEPLLTLLLAFCSFCLCASAVYIANDLLDLPSDRKHPRKRRRPFARGLLPLHLGVLLLPLLLGSSGLLAWQVGPQFSVWLLAYFALTCAYSFYLKRIMVIDCIALAGLYTLRLVAGAAAVQLPLSFWLLAFSGFLFLSLAFVKRYAELRGQTRQGMQQVHGRGYYTSDASLIQMLGVTAGYGAVLVLALYINSAVVIELYRAPELIWGTIPVTLFWVSWIWMQADRGNMHDDPLVFALRDRASLWSGLVFMVILSLGALGKPW